MALTIKFLTEPGAGRTIEIGDDRDEVTFGRATDADVGFPVELDIVSRDHFRLRRELGVYKFVVSREKPVFSRGKPILDGEELDDAMEVQLSGPSGPKLRIERVGAAASNFPKTQVLKGGQDIGDFAQQTRSGGRRLATGLAIVALLIAAIAGGVYFLRSDLSATQEQLALVKTELPAIKADVAAANKAAAAQMDTAAIMDRVHDSVYHVQRVFANGSRFEGGTASVIQLPDGTKALATNSHVADEYFEMQNDPAFKGGKLVVVQPKGPDYVTLEVTSVKKHPGYDEFGAWSEKVFMDSMAMAGRKFVPIPAYDVAILYVAEPEKLGEPLKYASRETIMALKQGEPLMTLGYSSEGLAGTDIMRPEPTAQYGVITAMTTFYLYRGAAEDNQLVQHSAPGTGGCSGSPMFNARGEVVAFYNAGNNAAVDTYDGARVPSAAQVNYAIRADLIIDLIEGKSDALMSKYRGEMAEEEKRLQKSPDEIVADLTNEFGIAIGDQDAVTKVQDTEVVMDQTWKGGPANGLMAALDTSFTEPAAYAVIALSVDRRPIQVLLADREGNVQNAGADFSHVSFMFFDNRDLFIKDAAIAVLDFSSTGEAKVTPGKVKLVVLKGVIRGS